MKTILAIAVIIGIFGNCLFLLGIVGWFYPTVILAFTILYFVVALLFARRYMVISLPSRTFTVLEKGLLFTFAAEVGSNLVGVLGPEIGFDALWYHLTLPKIFLLDHTIRHIPGGLLYYSDMPKLTELLYSVPLSFQSETGAKLIHFFFGLGICLSTYLFTRRYTNRVYAMLAMILFYANLVVGWESISAYVDLARTFFEFLAFILVVSWSESGRKRDFYLSGVMLGLAVSTKLLALSSLPIYLLLITYVYLQKRESIISKWKEFVSYIGITFFVPFPWFLMSYLSTGKPFYPFFTDVSQGSVNSVSPIQFVHDVFILLTRASDPLSPLYLIFLPFIVIAAFKRGKVIQLVSLFSLLSLLIWYFLPRIGGGRFILPYLPVYSFLTVYSVWKVAEFKKVRYLKKSLIFLVLFYGVISLLYRGAANVKFLPYLMGRETKAEFLNSHLNFSYGDFYDTDGYLTKTIQRHDKVLLYGLHNLYYVDFPFIDNSSAQKGEKFNYILTQNTVLPSRFSNWNLLYTNSTTHVMLYGNGGMMWEY